VLAIILAAAPGAAAQGVTSRLGEVTFPAVRSVHVPVQGQLVVRLSVPTMGCRYSPMGQVQLVAAIQGGGPTRLLVAQRAAAGGWACQWLSRGLTGATVPVPRAAAAMIGRTDLTWTVTRHGWATVRVGEDRHPWIQPWAVGPPSWRLGPTLVSR